MNEILFLWILSLDIQCRKQCGEEEEKKNKDEVKMKLIASLVDKENVDNKNLN